MIGALVLALAAAIAPAQGEPCPPESVEAERTFTGVYIDAFEEQRFFDGAHDWSDVDHRARSYIWLELDLVGLGQPFGIDRRVPDKAYRVRFTGVLRSRGTDRMPCGYGHMNVSAATIRVTHLIAIDPLADRSTLGPAPVLSSDNPR